MTIDYDSTSIRDNRIICLPFFENEYLLSVYKPSMFRSQIDKMIRIYPELFPSEIIYGYSMKDIYHSIKLSIPIRRIEISGISYTIRPSFVMPYLTAKVDDVEKPLFLRKFDVPFWVLAYVFGRDPMYWYRMEQSLGRNSIVGTTVRKPEDLPNHLIADEKHTWIRNKKVYAAMTAGNDCILGVSVASDAGEDSLTKAYGVFSDEVKCIKPDYQPETVNTDGWKPTQKAWKTLFPAIVIICCFLHMFIKIRDRAKKKFGDIFHQISEKLWDCYRGENRKSFSQRIRRLYEWGKKTAIPDIFLEVIDKIRRNLSSYSLSYNHPGAHRTSNMLERIMQRLDRHLFNTQYFHGFLSSAELSLRGWALIFNFAPSNPYTVKKYNGFISPAERLNKFKYHQNWLQNLLISSSRYVNIYAPQNPL